MPEPKPNTASKTRTPRSSSPQPSSRTQRNKAIVGAAGRLALLYLAFRVGLSAFHRSRRCFLRQLVFDLAAALQASNITYWVDFGSLLGIHRDGDLIPHDNDIDVVVLNPDWEVLLPYLKEHLQPKYSVKVVTPLEQQDASWIRVYCPLGMADLFGAKLGNEDDDVIHVECGHENTMNIPRHLVLPTATIHWRGGKFEGPADVPGALQHRYGPNWITPAYMDKGADVVENNKPYAKLFRLLGRLGLRI